MKKYNLGYNFLLSLFALLLSINIAYADTTFKCEFPHGTDINSSSTGGSIKYLKYTLHSNNSVTANLGDVIDRRPKNGDTINYLRGHDKRFDDKTHTWELNQQGNTYLLSAFAIDDNKVLGMVHQDITCKKESTEEKKKEVRIHIPGHIELDPSTPLLPSYPDPHPGHGGAGNAGECCAHCCAGDITCDCGNCDCGGCNC